MTKDTALTLALEALELSRDDVCECLNQLMPNAGFERYDKRIAAYQEQLIAHDAAIARIKEALAAPQVAHSDHPMRHYDRTCPACNAAPQGEPDGYFYNSMNDGVVEASIKLPGVFPLYEHPAPAPQYPLPDSLYPDSKDWLGSDYAGRVEWLHSMYENARDTLDEYLSQAPAPLSDEQIERYAEEYYENYRIAAGCAHLFARDIERHVRGNDATS